jgi:hypothetical protein
MPYKFMHPFTICLVTLFAYGLEGIARCYLAQPAGKAVSLTAQVKNWWKAARGFDRKWTVGMTVAIAASVLSWLFALPRELNCCDTSSQSDSGEI